MFRYRSLPHRRPADQAAAPLLRDPSVLNHHQWVDPVPDWVIQDTAAQSESDVLEEQMLHAGILASLQDAPDDPNAKVEVPKSSVSSLRLVITLFINISFWVCFNLLTLLPVTVLINVIKSNHSCFLSDSSSWRRWDSPQRKPSWHWQLPNS